MSLLERLLRGLLRVQPALREVRVDLPEDAPAPPPLPADLVTSLPISWSREGGPFAERFRRAAQAAGGGPLLALSADTIVDTRLLQQLSRRPGRVAFVCGEGPGRGAVVRWEGGPPETAEEAEDAGDLVSVAERAIARGEAKRLGEDDFDAYLTNLRRTLPPYVFRIHDDPSRDRTEHFLFWSNYKGSTDFLTRYVYPPLVWRLVRPLARWRVHPNWVTALDWLAAFVAVPLFAAGQWLPGLGLAYAMTVLDSVDGKLARLTFTSSRLGDVLDHGLDIVHPPIWYLAWAWALGGGQAASAPFQAGLWMLGLYVVDRLLALAFKSRTGRSIHGYTPIDERLRTFISRRNVNLAVFTLALLADWAVPGHRLALGSFYLIVVWQAASFLWHAERLARFWNAGVRPGVQPT